MPRPKKQPQDRMKKDGFTAPQYLLAAAKTAADISSGKDFSPWVVAAITEKLERDRPGLIAQMRAEMQAIGADLMLAEAAGNYAKISDLVAHAVGRALAAHGGAKSPPAYPTRPAITKPRKKS